MNELATRTAQLPDTLNDLARFALIGREKLTAVRAEIRAIDKVGLAEEVRRQKLEEAQAISEAVLDAEVKIGELMSQVPKEQGRRNDIKPTDTAVGKYDVIKEAGFTPKQVERFETLAKNPDIVEQAKAEARENDDVVSRSLVLNMVKEKKKSEKKQERQQAIQEQIEKPKTSNHVDIYTTDKKYRVIYADPPWSYNDECKNGGIQSRGASGVYPTMPLDDICKLPIPSAKDAVLFIWVTSPILEDVFKVIGAWGFKYKASFVWDKVAHNVGHYNSVRHEFLLIATKGSCTPDTTKLFDSVVSIERTEHSRKPKEFREMIDTLYPVGERLEMFAREAPEGWDVWGNMA